MIRALERIAEIAAGVTVGGFFVVSFGVMFVERARRRMLAKVRSPR